ncbi:MAG: dienelactone hydrolase family protein [Verrucomicrobia bacterium]|nr:dienelactone hydrolase family protein [Verrucomicrobiota bacterium]
MRRRTFLQLLAATAVAARAQTPGPRAGWPKRRAQILAAAQEIMGPLPGDEKRCALDVRMGEEVDCGSHVRRLITYASEPGSRTPAYLLLPKSALAGKPAPAALCLHGTNNTVGHGSVIQGIGTTPNRQYASELAERGFVTIAPNYPRLAKYQPDIFQLGYAGGTMKAIWDNVRALDLLDSLPETKHGAYGAIGHSLGGHNAIYTAVFEPRIKAVVTSCGFDSFRDYFGGDPKYWERGKGWCQDLYMPRLAQYRGRLEEIPFDFNDLLAASAPRPIFVNAPLKDSNFRWQSVDRLVAAAREVYALLGAPDGITVEHPDGPHDFPPEVRRRAYAFLEKVLT